MFVNSRVFTQAREVETRSYKDPLTLKLQSAKLFKSNIRSFHLFSFFSMLSAKKASCDLYVLIYRAPCSFIKLSNCVLLQIMFSRGHMDLTDLTLLGYRKL